MLQSVPPSWREALAPALSTPQARQLGGFLSAEEGAGKRIYPPRGTRLRALELTPLDAVKVVILGQDPYHGPGQAHGLSFSVLPGVKVPPSLRNIYKELESDLGLPRPDHGHLENWARQGVLLLNTCLTVEEGQPASHANRGWEVLTDAVIRHVSAHAKPCVFMLWGAHAQSKRALIDASRHRVLCANHPSPLSALRPPVPFIGCGHFSQAKAWKAEHA